MIKSELMDIAFYKQHLKEKKMLADGSIYVYVQCINKFLVPNPDLSKMEPYNDFIIAYSIKKRNTHYYSILKSFIEWKIDDAKIKQKLLNGLLRPPIRNDIKRERIYLSEDKILQVINSLSREKHQVIALIQNLTGVRARDVLSVRQGGIVPEDYKGKPVLRLNLLGKRKKRNVIFIHDKIAQKIIWDFIMKFEGFNDFHFIELGPRKGRQGNINNDDKMMKMNYVWYWQDLKLALNMNGINKEDFATHDLRRCFARRVWEKYKDVHILQGLLNHARADTTLRYLEHSGLKNIDYYEEMQTQ